MIVDIPGYGKNKVNAAYLFGEYYHEPGGGQALAVQTMSQFFNVPIAYYVAVNFEGFQRVVDTVGGVDIDVPYSLDDYNYPSDDSGDPFGEIHVHFDQGLQHMDGKTALRYARTRHADNDFARNRRQLQVIMAVRQKALSLNLIPAIPNLIDDLGGMVETNIPFDQQLGLVQLGYNLSASNILTTSIDSTMIVPATLPDGSEGMDLDHEAAKPLLDHFFGLDSSESGGSGPGREISAAPSAAPSTTRKATPARTAVPPAR
jgi:LCP family protein required for cell wall assembly